MRTTHELKTWPEFFEQTRNGRKRFELRRHDRDFKVGDELLLKEWDPIAGDVLGPTGPQGHYSGREVLVRVDYILTAADADTFGFTPGPGRHLGQPPMDRNYVIMSVSLVH
jgi:hypothetical protein